MFKCRFSICVISRMTFVIVSISSGTRNRAVSSVFVSCVPSGIDGLTRVVCVSFGYRVMKQMVTALTSNVSTDGLGTLFRSVMAVFGVC